MLFIDPENTPDFKRSLLNAIVAPRPIGWISTVDPEGRANLAPFSHFNLVSTAPPVLIFSCNAPADRHEKDSLRNVRANGEFVTNLVTWELRNSMNTSSIDAPYGTDEFALAGLAKAPSRKVRPPRVAASPASMECKLLRIVEIGPQRPGDTRSCVVFGQVVGIHLDPAFVDPGGHFDIARTLPLTRLGGNQYASVGPLVELLRPSSRRD
ncbi:flavin reductase family protein [Verminephrobacter aporrectodeae subsp. tuberculatae]|uniref:flavin reductase family protein n=1 Tax=Verminephrobacter aporrectodeae TaxID=1110389 RepID=UPI00224336A5|nr:flavin reductase family protein [Verminephrobacter aporrectodeae]MCW8176642.1 flavin reductase family protein [Verminephrobacter aporrectodeae subsp. tuberculatae]MCW8204045.1 flavin reductase family protein [Verminephrobacter aporrectodeae subsp. tuberculatae]